MSVTIEQVREALENHLKGWINSFKGKTYVQKSYISRPRLQGCKWVFDHEDRFETRKLFITNASLTDERRRFMLSNPGFMKFDSRLRVKYNIGEPQPHKDLGQEWHTPVFDLRGINVTIEEAA